MLNGASFSPGGLGGDRLCCRVGQLPRVRRGNCGTVDRPFEFVWTVSGELPAGGQVVDWIGVEQLREAVPGAFVVFINHGFQD